MSAVHAPPLLRFKGAALGYGQAPVLAHVDLEVRPGEFWGVLGHNGSGKTTLLRTMLGLVPALKGGFEATGRHGGAPAFGYVPQKERLDPLYPLSARDVAEMGSYRKVELLRRLRRGPLDERVSRCLADCGATGFAHRRFSELSGGQKQRVLIARALAAGPELLALDEPMAGIDITTQRALLQLLAELKQRRALTIVMVSHRVSAERGLFTHIAWVDEGRVDAGEAGAMLKKGRLADVFRSEL